MNYELAADTRCAIARYRFGNATTLCRGDRGRHYIGHTVYLAAVAAAVPDILGRERY